MTAAVLEMPAPAAKVPNAKLPIGEPINGKGVVELNLDKLLAGRLLIQGSSGAGKSMLLRKIIEEAFEYVTCIIVDPEGEFEGLARHIGATTLRATELATEGLTAAAVRARHHRLALHLDLSDLAPDERINKAAAFFAGLISCPREDWANTVAVFIDEAHLLAPHLAASARDAETRRLGVATLTDMCARGRKRGIATIIATQRLAKLAASVLSELHNGLIGLNTFDRDVARAADFLGFSAKESERLRRLTPGQFYAIGPALTSSATLTVVETAITEHTGATPELVGPADTADEEAKGLLDLEALRETGAKAAPSIAGRAGARVLDTFLIDPAAPAAAKIIAALRPIAPNATTADNLASHLGVTPEEVNAALDLLGALGAVDTMPRGEARIARLSARLRLLGGDAQVVGLS